MVSLSYSFQQKFSHKVKVSLDVERYFFLLKLNKECKDGLQQVINRLFTWSNVFIQYLYPWPLITQIFNVHRDRVNLASNFTMHKSISSKCLHIYGQDGICVVRHLLIEKLFINQMALSNSIRGSETPWGIPLHSTLSPFLGRTQAWSTACE